jgi:ribosomal protein S18 acetylase RimI-like enzyme
VTLALVPFPADHASAVALAEEAVRVRLAPGEELRDILSPIVSAILGGRATGGLLRSGGEARGILLWEPAGPLGVALRLVYLTPSVARPDLYRTALDVAERTAGPIAFVAGPLGGMTAAEELDVLRGRGFAPFGRSEMAFPASDPVPNVPVPPGAKVRAVQLEDEAELARLHERAYHRHLDRFLSLEDVDPVRDADHQLRDVFSGRYGELLSPGSVAVTVDGRIASSVLAVRRPAHVLLVDVMTDPNLRQRGFGRAAVTAALVALRERGESAIVLNVTEENPRAVRLYSSLGFVRTLGPSKEWYDARRMTVKSPP